jgi:hypothetical protein
VKETGEQSTENAASSKKISRHAAGAALSQAIVFVQMALATHIRLEYNECLPRQQFCFLSLYHVRTSSVQSNKKE